MVAQEIATHDDGRVDSCPQDIIGVPTISGVIVDASRATKYKAAVEHQLVGDLAKVAPVQMAAIRHPMHVKCALGSRPPILWRSGAIDELQKKAGVKMSSDSSREVTIWSDAANLLGELLRNTIMGPWRPVHLKLSGRKQGLTEAAVCGCSLLLFRCAIAFARKTALSAGTFWRLEGCGG